MIKTDIKQRQSVCFHTERNESMALEFWQLEV